MFLCILLPRYLDTGILITFMFRFTVTLCYDGRAISPSAAQRFLDHVSASLSDPDFMVSEPIDPALDFDFARLL